MDGFDITYDNMALAIEDWDSQYEGFANEMHVRFDVDFFLVHVPVMCLTRYGQKRLVNHFNEAEREEERH